MPDYPAAVTNYATAPTSGALGATSPTQSELHDLHRAEIIATQTELGTDPAGDYATVKARLDALDLPVFDPVSYGAAVDGSTNDTAAWQAAINAAGAAGGGVVRCSKPGVSVIAGALQDTGGANAQLTLPQVDYADAECVPIVLCGPVPPAVVPSVIGTTPVPDRHLVLKSTLAAGAGALLGGYGPAGTTANFTNVHLVLEDVGFRMVSNPTNSAVDLRRVANVSMRRVQVDAGSFNVDGLTQPTTTTSYGLRLPGNNNGAHVHVREVDVVGFYTGVEFSEHANLDDVNAWGCVVGFNPVAANHASLAHRVMAVHCKYGIRFTGGAHAFEVGQFAIEHAAAGWNATTYDLDDASNYGVGTVRWWAVLEDSGSHDSFTVNGASGVTEYRVGEQPAGGGGSSVYHYRETLSAGAGDDTITLGATPVTNSVTVWVDGAVQWPGVDYTIAGDTITLGAALSGGEAVWVHYESTTSGAGSATIGGPPAVSIVDTFNRADNLVTLGTTSDGLATWTAEGGTWGIGGNSAFRPSGGTGTYAATINAGVADGTVSVKVYQQSVTNKYAGLVVRSDGSGNGIYIQVNGNLNQIDIFRRTGGANTTIGTAVAYTPAAGDVLSVELSGTSITAKVNGVTKVTATDATYQANTRHGLWCYTQSGMYFDDFAISG